MAKAPLVVGCNYHTTWQSRSGMRFVLADLNYETKKALLITRNTRRSFWTNIDDLVWIDTAHNKAKAERLKGDAEYLKSLVGQSLANNWFKKQEAAHV